MLAVLFVFVPLVLASPFPRDRALALQRREDAEPSAFTSRNILMDRGNGDIVNWQNVPPAIAHSVESIASSIHNHFPTRQISDLSARNAPPHSKSDKSHSQPDNSLINAGLAVRDDSLSGPDGTGTKTADRMVVPGFMLADEAASDIDRAIGSVAA